MVSLHHQSTSYIRYFLVVLCISMIIIQVSQALDADLSSSVEDSDEHELSRRNSKKVAHMLEQILRRGEMQVEPYRIHKFLGRLNRRKTNDQLKNAVLQQF
ncbi:unnamed protein product [Adineta ricciae]|uniref:Uncharacterized protein n=2 Tax=Adineta ricciae TaxID=249248 RepID=A0A816ADZ7_ADIRI|nr:unnamed protein product [Adineta ricciae]